MNIGYACQIVGYPGYRFHSCVQKNATPELLNTLISYNLNILEKMLRYNIENGIKLFRIGSNLIPFGSSPVNTLPWWEIFADYFSRIGTLAKEHGLRLSMHPGQYTVLNSPNNTVAEASIEDLRYHTRVLDALGLDSSHKVILHIGGIYGNKPAAIQRFVKQYHLLPEHIKARLIIENDDRQYAVDEVLHISAQTSAPVVFDLLHHVVLPPQENRPLGEWISLCSNTWQAKDGTQKLHYSQQAEGKRPGSHSDTIILSSFLDVYPALPKGADLMLEVKDKNLSALKCRDGVRDRPHIKYLERAWAAYKYTVLEHSPNHYNQIRAVLKDKEAYPVIQFYGLIEEALALEPTPGTAQNALHHVWGYFKKHATSEETKKITGYLTRFEDGRLSLQAVKRQLLHLAEKYEQSYLLNSYYFGIPNMDN